MCGRARLSSDVSEIKLVFSITPHRPTPNFAPSWNVAPTDRLPVVRYDPTASERSITFAGGRIPRPGSKPGTDFESARWPRSLGEPSRFRPTAR
jgi:putative SOS response-associated peptidase YedK